MHFFDSRSADTLINAILATLLTVVVLVIFSGCSIFGGGSDSLPSAPEVEEERRQIAAFERSERISLDLTKRMLNGIIVDIKGRGADSVGGMETYTHLPQLEAATFVIEELSHVKGEPEVELPPTVESAEKAVALIEKRGPTYKRARERHTQKLEGWINSAIDSRLSGGSSFWSSLKLPLLIIFIVIGFAVYIYMHIQFPSFIANIVGVAWAGLTAIAAIYMYQKVVIMGVIILLGAGVLYLVLKALYGVSSAREVVKSVQSGRASLTEDERVKFDETVERNMPGSAKKLVKSLKRGNDITSVKRGSRGDKK